jgi:hypothetical protein
VGPKVRVQAQRGTRAAVIALRPGLYLVAELPEQVAKSEFGALPLLAPMMVNAARRALVEDDGGPGPLTRLFQRRDADGVRMIRARRPAQLPGPVAQAPADQIGGLALGAAAIAWAVSAYEYAVNLREQTALAERELDARVAASRDGRVLQPSTLPPPPPPPGGAASNMGLWVLGGLAVVTGAVVLPTLLKR